MMVLVGPGCGPGSALATVVAAVPLTPSLVAVMVAVPAARPRTSPLALTLATTGLPLAQLTVRPLSTFPAPSFRVALSWRLAPRSTVAVAGLITTDATGALETVTVAVALCPPLVAVIEAEPAATPVTKPLALTVATAALLVAHVTARPLRAVPFESFGVAVNCVVAPTVRLAVAGLSVTEATGTFVTVTADVPLFPSLVAVIVADPAATPVTSPLALTVATAALLVVQVTARPLRVVPLASFGVAVNAVVAPTVRLAVAGLTVTEATGTLVTVMAAVPLCPSLVAVIVAEPVATPVTNPFP